MKKKILLAVLFIPLFLVAFALLLPNLYSIDHLRPKIIEAAEKQVRGKVEISKISFRIIPSLTFRIEGVALKSPADFAQTQNPFVKLSNVEVDFPLLSFLSKPEGHISIDGPALVLVSQGTDSNLKAFLAEPKPVDAAAEAAAKAEAEAQAAAEAGKPNQALGEMLAGLHPFVRDRILSARFRFSIAKASVDMLDLKAPKEDKTKIKDLDFTIEDIGLNTPIKIALKTGLEFARGTTVVGGNVESKGTLQFSPEGKDQIIDLDQTLELSGLALEAASVFEKKPGVDLLAKLKTKVRQNAEGLKVNVEELFFQFANLKLVTQMEFEKSSNPDDAGKILLKTEGKKIALAPFGNFVAPIRKFGLGGEMDLGVLVQGSLADPAFDISLLMADVKGTTPALKKSISDLKASIQVQGTAKKPEIKIPYLSMRIGASDLNVSLKAAGAPKLSADLNIVSNRLDVDELLGLKPVEIDPMAKDPNKNPEAEKKAKEEKARLQAEAQKTPPLPLDEALNQMAPSVEESLKNPMLDKVAAKIQIKFKSMKVVGAEFQDATLNFGYDARKLRLNKTGIGGYSGRVNLETDLDLDPKALGYRFLMDMKGVESSKILATHMPKWKEALSGSMNLNFSIKGIGLRREQLQENLKGQYSADLKDGRTNLPVMKMLQDAVAGLPGKAKEQSQSALKGKEQRGRFKSLRFAGNIEGRKVSLNPFDINYLEEGAQNAEIRLLADGQLDFDQNIELLGNMFVPQEIIKVQELVGPSGKVEIPFKAKGTMSDPKVDIAYTAEKLGKRYLENALKSKAAEEAKKAAEALKQKQQEELKRRAEEELKKAPPAVQKGVEDLRKKFKF